MSQPTEDRFDPGVPHSSFSSCCADGRGGLGLEEGRDGPGGAVEVESDRCQDEPCIVENNQARRRIGQGAAVWVGNSLLDHRATVVARLRREAWSVGSA